jgi:DDE superfamily endonuclease
VRHEVVDPADAAAIAWLGELFTGGRADLYGQDEADLALLPTLTRTWMRRGQQLKLPAPGTNEKRSVSALTDLADGELLWRTDASRDAAQFCATLAAGADRSTARGRLAVFLVDNAPSHQVGKTGIVRRGLNELAGRVVLVFLPRYSPDLQPTERLWRQWRPNVTHNHTRATMTALQGDSDAWLGRMAAQPGAVLQALALPPRLPPGLSRDCRRII